MDGSEIMLRRTKTSSAIALTLLLGTACVPMDKSPGFEVAGDYPGHAITQGAITQADFAVRVKALADDRFAGRGPHSN
jgi:hypothetical protein